MVQTSVSTREQAGSLELCQGKEDEDLADRADHAESGDLLQQLWPGHRKLHAVEALVHVNPHQEVEDGPEVAVEHDLVRRRPVLHGCLRLFFVFPAQVAPREDRLRLFYGPRKLQSIRFAISLAVRLAVTPL